MPGPRRGLLTRSGLTARAWTFIVCGLLLLLVGMVTRIGPAVQFGALALLLPVAAATLTRPPAELQVTRMLSARELPTGDALDVTIDVRGKFPRRRTLLLEDRADEALGGAHRLAVGGASGHAVSRPQYRVRAGRRGVHHLGPLLIHVVDRFGMIHRVVELAGREEVLVTPRVLPLPPAVLGGGSLGSGSGHLGPLGAETDDVIPRAYRPGDEVRRIDWKASARTGDLMVRSEENPWRSAVTLVIDTRAQAHRGNEPHSSLDVVLTFAASVGALALDTGWDLTVLTTDDSLLMRGSPVTGVDVERRALLRALATVPASGDTTPNPTLAHSVDRAGAGPVVAIMGHVTPDAARVIGAVGAHSRVRMTVALRVDQWGSPGTGPRPGLDDGALGHLHACGWRISRVEHDTSIAQAWAGLVGPS